MAEASDTHQPAAIRRDRRAERIHRAPSFVTPAHRVSPTPSILPAILIVLWLTGFIASLTLWLVRWNRIRSAFRYAIPLTTGREAASLERLTGPGDTVDLVLSRQPMEPVVFGIVHPVISLPAGMADRLDDCELDAVLAHELCHLRNRDNLFAALHTTVSAIFWFHPLLWWIGARIVEEREPACDEEVVTRGAKPELYSEAILKICRFCLQSPLTCAAGIGGANLTKRIEDIVTHPFRQRLTAARKLMLAACAACSLAAPVAFGFFAAQTQTPLQWQIDGAPIDSAATASKLPAFEVASIKPSAPDSQLRSCHKITTTFMECSE